MRWKRNYIAILENGIQLCIELVELVLIVAIVVTICIYLGGPLHLKSSTWTFGQIVAVAVWFPIIIDWGYSVFRKSRPAQNV